MTEEEKIELVARAMCEIEWLDPDTLVHFGMPLMVNGTQGYAARPISDARPYWTFKRRAAEAAIAAISKLASQ